MNTVVNSRTGNTEVTFNGKLVSISEQVLQNTNGKNYKVASIDFTDANGKDQRVSALVFEGNYQHGMKIGETYLARAIQQEGYDQPLITLSHLQGSGERATFEMFGFSDVKTSAPAPVGNDVP